MITISKSPVFNFKLTDIYPRVNSMTYYELDKLSRRFSEWISYLALRDLAEAYLISAIA